MKLKESCYKGEILPIYCQKNNIDYVYIRTKIRQYKHTKKAILPLEFQISMAIKEYNNRRLQKYKWKNIIYHDTTLSKYCHDNNIIYNKIARRCRHYVKVGNDFSSINDEIIDVFIQSYFFKEETINLKRKLSCLEKDLTETELKSLCKELNLNYKKLNNIKQNNLNIKQYVIISYFSSDKTQNGRYMSKKRLNELENNINLDINDLIGLYKAGKNEYLNTLLDIERSYLRGFIFQTIKEYNFIIAKNDYNDLYQQAELLLIKFINQVVYSEPGRIINYLKKCIKKQMISYLKENYSNKFLEYDDSRLIN